MADIETLGGCCGIQEIAYIAQDGSPEDVLMSFEEYELCAHAIFSVTSSQTAQHRKGRMLADYIRKHKLGAVVATHRGARNPSHAGTIKAWIWTPNHGAFRAWQAKMRKRFPEKWGQKDYYGNPYRY
jgi:hypothetical protein